MLLLCSVQHVNYQVIYSILLETQLSNQQKLSISSFDLEAILHHSIIVKCYSYINFSEGSVCICYTGHITISLFCILDDFYLIFIRFKITKQKRKRFFLLDATLIQTLIFCDICGCSVRLKCITYCIIKGFCNVRTYIYRLRTQNKYCIGTYITYTTYRQCMFYLKLKNKDQTKCR